MGETENMKKINQEQAHSLKGRDGEIKKHHGALSVLNVNVLKSYKYTLTVILQMKQIQGHNVKCKEQK